MKRILPILTAALLTASTWAAAPGWVPLTGNWKQMDDGGWAELSDGVGEGNRPLWLAGANPEELSRLSAEVSTLDGVGDLYLAAGWRNADNFYALRYSDPHRKLELLRVADGRETVLAETENAGKISPQKEPLRLELRLAGGVLTGRAGETELSAVVGEQASPGAVALGTRYRQGIFRRMELGSATVPAGVRATIRREGWRNIFRQGEKNVPLKFDVTSPVPVELTVRFADGVPERKLTVDAARGEARSVTVGFPAGSLRPGDYPVSVRATANGRVIGVWDQVLTVAPDPDPGRFPVILWDSIDSLPELARLGFTAASVPFFFTSKYTADPKGHLDAVTAAVRKAEAGMPYGVGSLIKMDLRRGWDKTRYADWMMKDAGGNNQLSGDICHNHPGFRRAAADSAEALGKALADAKNPAYVLFDSETENEERKLTRCHHPDCLKRAAEAGFPEVPPHLDRTWAMVGVSLGNLAKQAKQGVVPGDSPEERFLKWWWLHGSGFVDSRAEAAEILGKHLPEAKRFHDPILRNPPYLGRDRGMDFVSHWTYTNPSPLALLENIDEMRAAVGYAKPVAPNIQLFWYTNEVIGTFENAADRSRQAEEAAAAAEARDAVHFGRFVTISPDHLREALWLAMSRPVESVMLDGGSAISTTPGTYAATNPDTAEALAEVSDQLIRPYGPMLGNMTGSPARVALIQSAASTLIGRTGNFGNANKYFADVYNSVLLAQLQPEILFEESIDRLGRYEVLILADMKILPRKVYDAVLAFAAQGKTVLMDRACPLEIPGAVRVGFPVTEKLGPAEQQQAWQDAAAALEKVLAGRGFVRPVSSPDPAVIIGTRTGDGDRAIFVVNDARRAGTYVGRFGKVLDAGIPRKVRVNFTPELTAGGRVVYDTASRRALDPAGAELFLPAGGGRLLYVAESEITGLELTVGPRVRRGESATVKLRLSGRKGLRGAQAVELDVRDADGRRNSRSGYYALRDGSLEVTLPAALNDTPGFWRVTALDLIAGNRAEAALEVLP